MIREALATGLPGLGLVGGTAAIKLTLHVVGAELDQLEMQYPGSVLEPAVARRYRGLARRERRLAKAFNRSVAKHNAFLKEECTED